MYDILPNHETQKALELDARLHPEFLAILSILELPGIWPIQILQHNS